MRRAWKTSGLCSGGLAVWMLLCGHSLAAEGEPAVTWSAEWVVFAPVHHTDPVVDADMLRAIPPSLKLPARERFPARVLGRQTAGVEYGKPLDLSGIFGEIEPKNVAYVFIELLADRAGGVTVGMGADWWLQAWINGEPVFDTLEGGNGGWPVSILNHTVTLSLRKGRNVLAIRYMTGSASAELAVAGADAFAAAEARLAARQRRRDLNTLPDTLAGRMVFAPDRQAVATADMTIDFPVPEGDLSAGALAGLRPMPARQVYLNAPQGRKAEILDTEARRFDVPVALQLSKYEYPAEDGHLDAIVWATPPEGGNLDGVLRVVLKRADGTVLAEHEIGEWSPTGLFFSVGFPPSLAGNRGLLVVEWRRDQELVGKAEQAFDVHRPAGAPRNGRIALNILNEPGAALRHAPMTLGVPFPNGALHDARHVRLVDETGGEMPLQTRVTARWSRFGPVKWLLCDFTADLDGKPRTVFLEYGPEVDRRDRPAMPVETGESGGTRLDTGCLQVADDGIWFRKAQNGSRRAVLSAQALRGAFVTREDGTTYGVSPEAVDAVEEHGSEKTVLRRTGWYVDPGSGKRFCQYVTRLVFHRDSPVVRIFHTWIFTGDGNRERIRNMGWRFASAEAVTPGGFLESFESPAWVEAGHLVQHDYRAYRIDGDGEDRAGRTPGVLSARVGETRVLLGAKDFWQNFPSELEIGEDGFTFYNWPRHNPPARFERPVTPERAFLHRFAHEGELLDFRLPDEYAEDPIWSQMKGRSEVHWDKGRPETANAQGIARTEELFLYFADAGHDRTDTARVMQGLNDETLRAVVDPAWLAASAVFGAIHERDREKYPEDEHIYDLVVHAPERWNERLGFYGMWLHGDVPAWNINLESRTVQLYRAIRKRHHGWPVSWLPFARSGDPRMLKAAEAATRQQSDASFCHYASEDVDRAVGPGHHRRQGWWVRGLLPWAGKAGPVARNYTVDSDFLWNAYYLTGYTRARDVALLWGALTQHDYGVTRGPRTSSSLRRSYLDMYEATFDPWYLAAVHEIAKLHLRLYDRDELVDPVTTQTVGHFWRASELDFHRYAGGEPYRRLALNNCMSWSSPRAYGGGGLWPRLALPLTRQSAYAYLLTGDDLHLSRTAAYLDWARFGVYDGEPDYARGAIMQAGTSRGIFTGYYIRSFPYALAAFERAGYRPEPIPNPIFVSGREVGADPKQFYEFRQPEVIIRKDADRAIDLMLLASSRAAEVAYDYRVVGSAGDVVKQGAWRLDDQPGFVNLTADAPKGDYRLQVSGRIPSPEAPAQASRIRRRHGLVLLPAARPGVPEVIRFEKTEAGTQVANGQHELQYWFQVPEAVEEFWVDFPIGGGPTRIGIWNPDGERVWDRSFHETNRVPDLRITVPVPPEQRGKLWRVTGGVFRIDPKDTALFFDQPGQVVLA